MNTKQQVVCFTGPVNLATFENIPVRNQKGLLIGTASADASKPGMTVINFTDKNEVNKLIKQMSSPVGLSSRSILKSEDSLQIVDLNLADSIPIDMIKIQTSGLYGQLSALPLEYKPTNNIKTYEELKEIRRRFRD